MDAALNQAVYGPGVTVDDILECKVPPPPEFAPLYRLLDGYAREALRSVPSVPRLSLAPGRSPGVSPRSASMGALRARSSGGTVEMQRNGSLQQELQQEGSEHGSASTVASSQDLQAIQEEATAEAAAARRRSLTFSQA